MKLASIFLVLLVFSGCQALSHKAVDTQAHPSLKEAEQALYQGEYYRARKTTQALLRENPEDAEAQALMAGILEQEIAQQKEIFETKVPGEYSKEEKSQQTRTWLERSREMFRIGRYQEALQAAEEVFIFDPGNVEASGLIDDIRKKVYAEGKAETVFLKQMYQDEMAVRIQRYKDQARSSMERGRWGAASLAIEKALLLSPEDREAQHLHENIKTRKASET